MDREADDTTDITCIRLGCTGPPPTWLAGLLGEHAASIVAISGEAGARAGGVAIKRIIDDKRSSNSLIAVVVLVGGSDIGPEFYRALLGLGVEDVLPEEQNWVPKTLEKSLEYIARRNAVVRSLAKDGGLIGKSASMQEVRKALAEASLDSDAPVLILGETGTGKYLAAEALHVVDAQRATHPFHAVDCGSIVETLFGSEIFGHVRGAFTGAQSNRAGAISSAGDGTLLFDEIGELPLLLQASLLTALQQKTYRPVGFDKDLELRCRIVAATNSDLTTCIKDGKFRSDLFYRLDGRRVVMPPLRDRREDIPEIFGRLVQRHVGAGRTIEIEPDVLALLQTCPLPGNVRELDHVARRCAVRGAIEGRVRMPHLPKVVQDAYEIPTQNQAAPSVRRMVEAGRSLEDIKTQCTEFAIAHALEIARRSGPSWPKGRRVRFVQELLKVSERTVFKYEKHHRGNGKDASHLS